MELAELIAEANLGLVEAADTFDPAKAEFSTYAVNVIRNRLVKFMDAHYKQRRIKDNPKQLAESLVMDGPEAATIASDLRDRALHFAWIVAKDKLDGMLVAMLAKGTFDAKSLREIASEVGLSAAAVHKRVKSLMARVRERLESES
jgi:RNA polymerase sigma factor (sigma-70 family)